jgi:hypothetical protein
VAGVNIAKYKHSHTLTFGPASPLNSSDPHDRETSPKSKIHTHNIKAFAIEETPYQGSLKKPFVFIPQRINDK